MDTVTITRTITQEFTYKVLNGIVPMDFLVWLIYALMGLAFTLALVALKRDPHDTRTPTKFSLSFLIKDNAVRIIASIFVIIPAILLSEFFLGQKATTYISFLIGAGVDLLVIKITSLIKSFYNVENKTNKMNQVFWDITDFSANVVSVNSNQIGITVDELVASNDAFSYEMDTQNNKVLMVIGNSVVIDFGTYQDTSVNCDFIGGRPVRK